MKRNRKKWVKRKLAKKNHFIFLRKKINLFFPKRFREAFFCRGHATLHLAVHPSIEFLNSEWFLGSGPKGPMSCRTQGGILILSFRPSTPHWPGIKHILLSSNDEWRFFFKDIVFLFMNSSLVEPDLFYHDHVPEPAGVKANLMSKPTEIFESSWNHNSSSSRSKTLGKSSLEAYHLVVLLYKISAQSVKRLPMK